MHLDCGGGGNETLTVTPTSEAEMSATRHLHAAYASLRRTFGLAADTERAPPS